jgi:hypothetical protein
MKQALRAGRGRPAQERKVRGGRRQDLLLAEGTHPPGSAGSFRANHLSIDASAEAPLRASRGVSDACVARRVRSCGGDKIVTIQPQSHVNGSVEKSTVVNVQGGVLPWNCRGCDTINIPEKHPRLRHFRASAWNKRLGAQIMCEIKSM